MILENVSVNGKNQPVNIHINNGKIVGIGDLKGNSLKTNTILTFQNAIAFPGLINSHDHLDFNLFPQLGNMKYDNYTQWGNYIHENYKEEISNILKIPYLLRVQWGIIKNLLGGVTTVVNHGEPCRMGEHLITILENTHCIHSVKFDKNWRVKLNNPLKWQIPVNIHIGEGIDNLAENEMDSLIKWNLLHRKLIGTHGVAMTRKQAKKFNALIWCPESNYFLFNTTAPVGILKKNTTLLFGTDATLTSNWNIWHHLQAARKLGYLNDEELYSALTLNPAKIWNLNSGEISIGKDADLVISKANTTASFLDNFFASSPESLLMVMHKGEIKLFDELLKPQIDFAMLENFNKVYVNGICKYVLGDLPGLMRSIKTYHPHIQFPITEHKL